MTHLGIFKGTPPALLRGRLGRILRLLLIAAVVAYLFHSVDLAAALERARSANPLIVAGAVVALTGVHAIAALTWRAIVARVGAQSMRAAVALRAYYASQALGGITPANLGGDAYRVMAASQNGGDWGEAAVGVLVQRATSFAALAMFGVAALAGLPDVVAVAAPLIGVAFTLAVMLAVPVVVLVRRRRPLADPGLSRSFTAATLVGLAGGAAFHAIAIAASYALVIAVDPSASGPGIVAALTLARLTLAVPIAPSGIGVQEGALAALFVVLGASPETAVASSLLGRLALLSTTGIGLLLIAGRRARAPGADMPAPAFGGVEPGTAQ